MGASPESRVLIGLATAGVVMAVNSRGLPSGADVRVGKTGDDTIETVRKQNLWLSAGIVSGIYLLTKDSLTFMMGGAMVVSLDWITRANNWANPVSGAIDINPFDVGNTESRQAGAVDAAESGYLHAVVS